jgi:hypothetical protein
MVTTATASQDTKALSFQAATAVNCTDHVAKQGCVFDTRRMWCLHVFQAVGHHIDSLRRPQILK